MKLGLMKLTAKVVVLSVKESLLEKMALSLWLKN